MIVIRHAYSRADLRELPQRGGGAKQARGVTLSRLGASSNRVFDRERDKFGSPVVLVVGAEDGHGLMETVRSRSSSEGRFRVEGLAVFRSDQAEHHKLECQGDNSPLRRLTVMGFILYTADLGQYRIVPGSREPASSIAAMQLLNIREAVRARCGPVTGV